MGFADILVRKWVQQCCVILHFAFSLKPPALGLFHFLTQSPAQPHTQAQCHRYDTIQRFRPGIFVLYCQISTQRFCWCKSMDHAERWDSAGGGTARGGRGFSVRQSNILVPTQVSVDWVYQSTNLSGSFNYLCCATDFACWCSKNHHNDKINRKPCHHV